MSADTRTSSTGTQTTGTLWITIQPTVTPPHRSPITRNDDKTLDGGHRTANSGDQ